MSILIPAALDLHLPAMRPTALELIQALGREESEIAEIAAIVRLDPVLTGRVLAYANSPFLMPLRPITDVQDAIIRMGRKEFQKIFYFTVLHDAFSSPNPEHETILRQLWAQSLGTSVAVELLQMHLGPYFRLTQEEFAVLTPLAALHTIGFLVLLHNFPDAFGQMLTPPPASMPELMERQQQLFGGWDHTLAGANLLRAWYFPELAVHCTENLLSPPPDADHVRMLLRLGTYMAIQAGLSFFPDAPPDFWTTPLPKGFDPSLLLDLIPQVTSTVEVYGGIWDENGL